MKGYLIYPKNNLEVITNLPPLGPLYLTSYLNKKSINASFFDFNIIKNWKKIFYEIIDEEPDFLALTSNVANFQNTLDFAKLVKRFNKDINIIVGGPYPTCVPEKYLENNTFDAVCIGEGERTLFEYITKNKKVPGLMIKNKNGLEFTGNRETIENLNQIPFPQLQDVNLKKYYNIFQKAAPISNIITSRGCPYNCTFCFHGVHGHKWRPRSPKNVFEEIKWQVESLGVRELCIWDDNFTIDIERAEKICDLIIKNKLKLHWQCSNGLRVDNVTRKLLIKMKKAGCWNIVFAPESGSPWILKKIQKGFTLEQVQKVRKWCQELEIFTPFYFMFGFPFENEYHVNKTISFIKKIKPDMISIHKFYPFPNTPISNEYDLKTIENMDYRTSNIPKYQKRAYSYIYRKFYINRTTFKRVVKFLGFKYAFLGLSKYSLNILKNRFANSKYITS